MMGEFGVATVEQRVVQVRVEDSAFEIVEVMCPTGLCGRSERAAPFRSWNPAGAAETGHITKRP